MAYGQHRDTSTIAQTRVVVEMEDTIAQLDPSETPFTVLLMKIAKETVTNPTFQWHEDEHAPRWDAINNVLGYNNVATILTVLNSNVFTVGDIVQVPRTRELMQVTAVNILINTITVRRGYGETLAAAIVDTDPLQVIGNANAEGTASRVINQRNVIPQFNYTQIFRMAFGITNTLKSTKLYGGNELDYQRKKKAVEHRIDMERAFLFGERLEDLINFQHPLRTTRGLLRWIQTNDLNMNGAALTEAAFDTWAQTAFDKGSETKILLACDSLINTITGFAKNRMIIEQGESTYGLNIMNYVTPHGKFKIVKHKLLRGAIYGRYGVAVDIKNVKMSTLKGRGTKLKTNIQLPDEDRQKDEYITEAGLKVRMDRTHAAIRNWA